MNFTHSLKDFDRFFVGFDPIMKKFSETAEQTAKLATNYPPYNIKKIDENKYAIEVAVAGFSKQDLEVELVDGKLIIKGNIRQGEEAEKDSSGEWTWPQYLYQGLAQRSFTRSWTLADNIEIKGGELVNGILKIWLEALAPTSKKVTIDIRDGNREGD